ncbi:MAG: AMP-binding protein [Phycisphaeraceae bacterium]|nr:AMP-binding protein [Phycisphaeraceae bacterium]
MSLIWPIVKQALKGPGHVACVDDRGKLTYGRLLAGAMYVAEAIESRTDRPHVGLLLPTSGAFPVAILGAWLARRVMVPLNYLLAKDELQYVIQDSGIDTIITVGPMLDFIGGRAVIPTGVKLLLMEEMDFSGVPPLRWPPAPADDALAALLYTSGTSGRPKGVMLSHGNFSANVRDCIVHAELTRADVFLGVLPQFHSFGLTALTLLPLTLGAKVVYTARFIPKRIIELMREHKPDVFMAVPSMHGALLSVKEAAAEDFASIRYTISGGEPLPFAIYEEFQSRFGATILEGYGLTETSPVTHWATPRHHRLHSVGRALPHVTQFILDDDLKPLPYGQDGEVFLAGPNIMQGYFKLPKETAAALIDLDVTLPDGRPFKGRALRTGDIGRIDTDGFLFITGRKKEMLIIGGENLFPREVEEVLNHHPSVKDSAVIGKNDGMRGEVPIAFVEIQEGAAFDETALRAFCRQRLAGYKVPREIHPIDALPRNPTGKILRRQLNAG